MNTLSSHIATRVRRPLTRSSVGRPSQRWSVVRAAAVHEPDRRRRDVAGVEQPVGRRRVEADRVAGLEHVLVEADPHGERAAQDVAPLLAGVALECVGRARLAADLVGHVEEVDVRIDSVVEALPDDAGPEPDASTASPLAARDRAAGVTSAVPSSASPGSAATGGWASMNSRLVERDAELVRQRVEGVDGRLGPAGLDLAR